MSSLVILAWGVWPVGRSTKALPIRLPGSGSADEIYHLELTWPAWLRVGDPGVIRLVLEAEQVLTIQASSAPQVSEVKRLAECRLEISGLKAVPVGEILEPLRPGRQSIYYWSLLAERDGDSEAIIWVSLRDVPEESGKSGSPALEDHSLLTAQKIPIRAFDLYGMDGQTARVLGGIGVFIGILLGLDGLFMWFRKRSLKEG